MLRAKYLIILFFLFGCGPDKPDESLVYEDLKPLRYNIKSNLGDDYDISELKLTKNYFIDENYYKYEFSFIINKQFTNPNPKKIYGYVIYYKVRYGYWVVKKNSILEKGILNLIE